MSGKKPPGKFRPKCYLAGTLVGLALLGGVLYWTVGRPLLTAKPAQQDITPVQVVLEPNAPYKQGDTIRLMNVSAARLEHQQFPQEFVVLKGLDGKTVERVFQKDFDPVTYKPMAEGLLSMKDPIHPVSIDLQKMETFENRIVPLEDARQLQTRRMRVTFRLSSEDAPRTYEGSVSRFVRQRAQIGEASVGEPEILYVSFARDDEYREVALPAFLKAITVR